MACIFIRFLDWIEHHPGTAGWVQGIGAIIALAVAIMVPIRIASRTERLARQRFLETIAAIGAEAQECLANAAKELGPDPDQGRTHVRSVAVFNRFRVAAAAVEGIPVHMVPHHNLVRAVIALKQIMSEGMMQYEAAFREIDEHQTLVQSEAYGMAFSDLTTRAHPYLSEIERAAVELSK